jgi:hypothetical protein
VVSPTLNELLEDGAGVLLSLRLHRLLDGAVRGWDHFQSMEFSV